MEVWGHMCRCRRIASVEGVPKRPSQFISLTAVKVGCVRSETGLVTVQINDHNSSLRRPKEGTLN